MLQDKGYSTHTCRLGEVDVFNSSLQGRGAAAVKGQHQGRTALAWCRIVCGGGREAVRWASSAPTDSTYLAVIHGRGRFLFVCSKFWLEEIR